MTYFANRTINRLYAHCALQSFAEYSGGLFVSAYLIKQGISIPVVFLAVAGFVLLRMIFRQSLMPFARTFGLRNALVAGSMLVGLGYVPLAFVQSIGLMLWLHLIIGAFGESWYWSSFHALSATYGDQERRGSQTSAVQLIYAVNFIAGPFLGGLLLTVFGPLAAFSVSGIAMVASTIPLLGAPNLALAEGRELRPDARRFARRIYAADGFTGSITMIASRLALFLILGESFQSFGSALAFAGLFGAVLGLGLGKLIDNGHGQKSTPFAIGLGGFDVLFRSFAVANTVTAVAAQAFGAVIGPLYSSAYNSRVYNISKTSGDPLQFQIAGEGGWDMGAAAGALLAAFLTWQAVAWPWIITMGLLGTGSALLILSRSYSIGEPSLRL